MKLGRVYFIQAGTDGPIKIGFTRGDVAERMAKIQVGAAAPLRIVAVISAPDWLEAELHDALRDEHVHGEWFRDGLRLRRVIRATLREASAIDVALEEARLAA